MSFAGLDPAMEGTFIVEADGTKSQIHAMEELLARLQVTWAAVVHRFFTGSATSSSFRGHVSGLSSHRCHRWRCKLAFRLSERAYFSDCVSESRCLSWMQKIKWDNTCSYLLYLSSAVIWCPICCVQWKMQKNIFIGTLQNFKLHILLCWWITRLLKRVVIYYFTVNHTL